MVQVINAQDVFNKVIASGEYSRSASMGCGMCLAARAAYDTGTITYKELIVVESAIASYIGTVARPYAYLASAIMGHVATDYEISSLYEETLAIYQDWENRPMELPLAKYKDTQA